MCVCVCVQECVHVCVHVCVCLCVCQFTQGGCFTLKAFASQDYTVWRLIRLIGRVISMKPTTKTYRNQAR